MFITKDEPFKQAGIADEAKLIGCRHEVIDLEILSC